MLQCSTYSNKIVFESTNAALLNQLCFIYVTEIQLALSM